MLHLKGIFLFVLVSETIKLNPTDFCCFLLNGKKKEIKIDSMVWGKTYDTASSGLMGCLG